jgi:hypothetical protein
MMSRFLGICALLVVVAGLGACGSVKIGRDFDGADVATRIEQNVTTQSQVRGWLGEPATVGVSLATDGERFDEWTYYFAEGPVSDMSTAKVKLLQIKFDKQGKVRSYSWSASKK